MSLAVGACSGRWFAVAAALILWIGACAALAEGPAAKAPPAPPWQFPSADALREQLALVPEIDVLRPPGHTWPVDGGGQVNQQFSLSKEATAVRYEGLVEHFRRHRSDLWGLPFPKGKPYSRSKAEAEALETAGDKVREAMREGLAPQPAAEGEPHPKRPDLLKFWSMVTASSAKMDPKLDLNAIFKAANPGIGADLRGLIGRERMPAVLPSLRQNLVVEADEVRRSLVDYLREQPSAPASVALARLAVFDVEGSVRSRALAAIQARPAADYLPVLLDALRHPLLPASQRAAEALAALKPKGAAARLVAMLAEPDPAGVVMEEVLDIDIPVKRELVRVNHLRNCLLCHPVSGDVKDPMRAAVAIPGIELPRNVYYRGGGGAFVRADVIYLHQDFSVMHKVKDAGRWPEWQRYDYLVRMRPLTSPERRVWLAQRQQGLVPAPSGQRQALVWALRQLTREDAGAGK